ncbi:hypothetical protein J2D73_16745 [Acetobacter sacchari]|uniref:Uncharacterized protein n=1 Tax=Acetobacter sacchari TaxID=2661687 RepID=A0ABS3LZT8_9PROT|nr:hypothetical protein [Acetobacter sacchari]MBO1361435.1 hypothetical protein [Acetobacter sacchari]
MASIGTQTAHDLRGPSILIAQRRSPRRIARMGVGYKGNFLERFVKPNPRTVKPSQEMAVFCGFLLVLVSAADTERMYQATSR